MFVRNGIWYLRRQVNGRRQTFTTGQSDYKLAEIKATEIEARLNKGDVEEFIEKKKAQRRLSVRYRAFATIYLREVSPGKLHKNAELNDAHNLRSSIDFFGDRLLTSITVEDCEQFVAHVKALRNKKGKPFKPNTIRNHIAAMRMVYREAIRRGLVAQDPWAAVDRKRVIPRGTTRDRVITPEEQAKVIAHMGDEERRAFIVMLGTGVREDELLRIEERHCDFNAGALRLTGGIVKGKTRYPDPDEAAREIPMQPAVAQALQEQAREREAGNVGAYYRRKQGPQLWNLSRTALSDKFTRAIAAAGIAPFTQHDCRRTFGTRCAEAGVKPHRLQAWLGHADISTTMKFYVHEQRQASREEMQRLDLGLPKTIAIVRRNGTAAV